MISTQSLTQTIRRSYQDNAGITTLLVFTLSVSWVFSALAIIRWLVYAPIMHTWPGPQFLFNYDEGFIRRGLPGQVLQLLGFDQSLAAIRILALLITLLGIASLIYIATLLSRRTSDPLTKLGIFVLVAASPFTISMMARDVGRFDAFGAVALAAALLSVRNLTKRPLLAISVSSLFLVTAVAASEFLIALLPVVLLIDFPLIANQSHGTPIHKLINWARVAILTLPSVLVAVASFVSQPNESWLLSVQSQAGLSNTGLNPVSALTQTFSQAIELVDSHKFDAVVTTVLYFSITALCLWAITRLLEISSRTWLSWLGYACALALTLSFIGIDYRRWWTFAFIVISAVAVVVKQKRELTETQGLNRKSLSILVIAAVVILQTQNIPGTFVEKGFAFQAYHAFIGFF